MSGKAASTRVVVVVVHWRVGWGLEGFPCCPWLGWSYCPPELRPLAEAAVQVAHFICARAGALWVGDWRFWGPSAGVAGCM